MSYDELVKYAEAMVNIVNKKYVAGNKLAYMPLLAGIGPMAVESFRGAGHNCRAVVDAVHKRYAIQQEETYQKGYEEGIQYMVRMAGTMVALSGVLNVLYHQMKLEKEGTAQFAIDREDIFEKLNEKIRENWDSYNKENKSFAEWFERNRQYALDNYGIRLG